MSVPPKRLAGLDGLRGIAVALVVMFHFFPAVLPGGFIGVDVFFVISGFLITGLLITEWDDSARIALGRFWKRRARRLVPPLIPLVVISCTAAWLLGGDVLVGLGRQLLGAVTFGYNWVSIAGSASYFTATAPELFRNLWSLAVEEQFYLVWPFALLGLLLVRNGALRLALVATLALASAAWMGLLVDSADPTRVYYGSDTHSFGLFAGAALALLLRRSGAPTRAPRLAALLGRRRPWLGAAALAGILAAALALPETGMVTYRGGLLLVSLLSAVVIWAAVQGPGFGAALDTGPLRYLGERSYGIYLWHWPVLVLTQAAWPVAGASPGGLASGLASGLTSGLVGVLAGTLTLLAAGASYRWLERPVRVAGVRGSIRRLRSRSLRTRGRFVWLGLLGVIALLLAAGTTAALLTAPTQTSAASEIERGQKAVDAAERQAERSTSPPATGTPGRAASGDLITAVGDSVMLASAPELQAGFPGIVIDAAVSRGMGAAPDILAALAEAGTLRPVVVVGLGTNGPIRASQLTAIRQVIGPDRDLVLVTAFAERDWTAGVNDELARFSARHRQVELADWSAAIAPHSDVLADDNIHPGPVGGRIYADSILAALERLAVPPPEPGLEVYRVPDPAGSPSVRPPLLP